MLRHYTLIYHESCQRLGIKRFRLLFFFTALFLSDISTAQNSDSLEIVVKQVEYIDANTERLTYLNSKSEKKELMLSRNYNHVFVELEKDPGIQYAYKVTGEATLGDWKNTTNEIHLVGLSRGFSSVVYSWRA